MFDAEVFLLPHSVPYFRRFSLLLVGAGEGKCCSGPPLLPELVQELIGLFSM